MVKNIPGQSIDDSQVIWRYMDFVSFYSILVNGSLFFRRLDKYTDANEGTLPPETIKDLRRLRMESGYETSEQVDFVLRKLCENYERERSFTLSNSWMMDSDENYAMWKIYLRGTTEGIAIKTTIGKLRQALTNSRFPIYLGKVSYKVPSTDYISPFEVATWKRPAYKYEKEFRLLMIEQSMKQEIDGANIKVPLYEVGQEVDVDINCFLNEIFVSPFSSPWFINIIQSAIHRLGGPGLQIRIMPSEIQEK